MNCLSSITPSFPNRFCLVTFDTKKLNRKQEVFALLSFVPKKEHSSLIRVNLFINIRDWTEAKHDCEPFSAAVESSDAKDTYSWLSSG